MTTERTRINFRVYGLEFCRMLEAVGLFQATPREAESHAAVRCVAGTGGLSMFALNLRAAAAGHVDIEHESGHGLFSIPHAQVRNIKQIFKRRLPKDHAEDEYMLEVTVTDREIKIADVSDLFSGDVLTVTVPEEVPGRGDESESDRVIQTASVVLRAVDRGHAKIDLTTGRSLNPVEVGRVSKAAGILGTVLHAWPVGASLVFPLGDSFVANLIVGKAQDDAPRPLQDEQTITEWRERLEELVDHGVI